MLDLLFPRLCPPGRAFSDAAALSAAASASCAALSFASAAILSKAPCECFGVVGLIAALYASRTHRTRASRRAAAFSRRGSSTVTCIHDVSLADASPSAATSTSPPPPPPPPARASAELAREEVRRVHAADDAHGPRLEHERGVGRHQTPAAAARGFALHEPPAQAAAAAAASQRRRRPAAAHHARRPAPAAPAPVEHLVDRLVPLRFLVEVPGAETAPQPARGVEPTAPGRPRTPATAAAAAAAARRPAEPRPVRGGRAKVHLAVRGG